MISAAETLPAQPLVFLQRGRRAHRVLAGTMCAKGAPIAPRQREPSVSTVSIVSHNANTLRSGYLVFKRVKASGAIPHVITLLTD